MSVVMLITSLPLGVVHAGMVTTETVIKQQSAEATASAQSETSRERIRDLLARDDVRDEMIALGIDPAEAEARLNALTDEEVAEIAGRLDELPAGGTVGTILLAIFITFGVAVLVDALGVLDIFPFVCGINCQNQQQLQAAFPEPAAGPAAIQTEPLGFEDRRSAFRRDRDSFSRSSRSQQGFDSNQFYEPQPQAPTRNYYQERFGAQRVVR